MIVIVLPWPPTELWPNRSNGTHWASSSGIRATQRCIGRVETHIALDGLSPTLTGARLSITFNPPTARRWDIQNAFSALKGALDGIADALGIDDSTFDPVELRRGLVMKGGSVVVEVHFQ